MNYKEQNKYQISDYNKYIEFLNKKNTKKEEVIEKQPELTQQYINWKTYHENF